MVQPLIAADQRSDGRNSLGQFGPGNPGRLRGSKNQVSKIALGAVQGLSGLAIDKLRERIEAGDMSAIKFTLEFTLPRGGRSIDLDTNDPTAVADALATGEISPDEADKIASAFGKLQSINEIDALRQRLEELEKSAGIER